MNRKRTAGLVVLVLILNFILIICAVINGQKLGNPFLRFEENQTVTFFSAFLLGLTGWSSFLIYRLAPRLSPETDPKFWLFSSLGFFYLSMDEYFMAHEGIDDFVTSLLSGKSVTSEMDGLTIATFGIIALIVCLVFRKEIIKYQSFLLFLILGAVCLVGTVFFDLFKALDVEGKVLEESFKIVGVSFFLTGYAQLLLAFIQKVPFLVNKAASK